MGILFFPFLGGGGGGGGGTQFLEMCWFVVGVFGIKSQTLFF